MRGDPSNLTVMFATKFEDAVALLLRAYDAGHRHGWEPGPSSAETIEAERRRTPKADRAERG